MAVEIRTAENSVSIQCRKCGFHIKEGESYLFQKGVYPYTKGTDMYPVSDHIGECPQREKRSEMWIRRPGPDKHDAPAIGSMLRYDNKSWIVEKVEYQYYEEDGMSFGVGDEQGWAFDCKCKLVEEVEAE